MSRRRRAREYDPTDPLLAACVYLVGGTGARDFTMRYDEEAKPVVWMAIVNDRSGVREVAAAFTPAQAAYRLVERLIDGGRCAHCGRTSGVSDEWRQALPLEEAVCWYVFDPETERFRRSCEGETTGRAYGRDADGRTVGRNTLCPCGSGKKWKRCHGV